MRILHVGKYYPPFEGGIENFLASLLKGTTKENLSHCVLAHHHQPWRSTSREVLPEGIVVRSFICCRLLFAPIAPFFYFHLKRLLAEFRPDVIHVHMPNLSAFWLLLPGRRFDTPLVVHWHADVIPSRKNPLLSLAYVLYRPLEKKLLARADAVIVTSAPYLESSRPLQAFRDKCHVIPLGLEDSGREKTADLSAPGQENAPYRLLCIGRLTYYKGQQFLIEAVSRLPEANLVVVGTGSGLQRCRRLVEKYGCQDRIRLAGHVDREELENLLQECDCLCLPSIERTEAFGLVLLEAMRQGKPCICTDVAGSGMSWVVQHGKTGLVARAGDVEALCTAIARLANDRRLAGELGRAGRDRFVALFSLKTVADDTVSLYNQLLVSRGCAGAARNDP